MKERTPVKVWFEAEQEEIAATEKKRNSTPRLSTGLLEQAEDVGSTKKKSQSPNFRLATPRISSDF
jgi:hypothetical protein